MSELCLTVTQVQLLRASILSLMGISVFQSLVTWRLDKELRFAKIIINDLHKVNMYLLNLIDKNEIELSEFDMIALKTILEEKTS